ncbi:uncharacterized protein LOC142661447 [Rhinoderma darwinii]|uniref:uncharacterized protein LOC142661447 n=1 Tax=Rhinoderma darwinii TaxID=43563 RepID=UPI003F66B09A
MNVAMSSNFFTIFVYVLLSAIHLSWGYKPEIQAFPNKVVRKGENVTIRCSSAYNQGTFRLQRRNTEWYQTGGTNVNEQNFTVTNVEKLNSTDYYCTVENNGGWWSEHSDILTLRVIDPRKPDISCLQDDSEDMQLLITCRVPDPPAECRLKRFLLYSGKERITDLSAVESSLQVTFEVYNLTAEYRCSYVLEVKEQPRHVIESPLSNRLTPTKCKDKEKTKSSNDDKEKAKSFDDDKEETNNFDNGVWIPVVSAVCGFFALILVVILVVYFIRKKKSSPQKMKNSEYCSEQAETTTEATYSTVNKMRPISYVERDVKDTGMDDDNDDGITYARLNKITLKQKNIEPDTPRNTDVYAEVKNSQLN